MANSDAESSGSGAARRFRRIARRSGLGDEPGDGPPAALPTAKRQRQGGRSVQAALKHAIAFTGAEFSSSEEDAPGPGTATVSAEGSSSVAVSATPSSSSSSGAALSAKGAAKGRGRPKKALGEKLSKNEEAAMWKEMKRQEEVEKRRLEKLIAKEAKNPRRAVVEKLSHVDGKVRKRDLIAASKAQLLTKAGTPSPECKVALDGISPEAEVRFRLRNGHHGGVGGGKKKNTGPGGGDDSGSEAEPEEGKQEAWERLLDRSREADCEDQRSAFSLKPCPPADIKRLDAKCFLGKKRPDEGGMLLFDHEGRVNLHFFLGTYKAMEIAYGKRDRDDDALDAFPEENRLFLRWLAKKARTLNIVNFSELKKGKVATKRMAACLKSKRFSLTLLSNQIHDDGSDKEDAAAAFRVDRCLDFEFPQRPRQEGELTTDRAKLREHISSRQAYIATPTSSNADLGEVMERLLAPTMSFDWEDKADDEEDWGGLEVELPSDVAGPLNGSKRGIFQDHLRRSVSFRQARHLAPTRGSSFSSLPDSNPPSQPRSLDRDDSNLQSQLPAAEGPRSEGVFKVPAVDTAWLERKRAGAATSALPQDDALESANAFAMQQDEWPDDVCGEGEEGVAAGAADTTAVPAASPLLEETVEESAAVRAPAINAIDASPLEQHQQAQVQEEGALLSVTEDVAPPLSSLQQDPHDWPFDDISPTAMWGRGGGVVVPSVDGAPLGPTIAMDSGDGTQPQVGKELIAEVDRGAGDAAAWEISPTEPFVPLRPGDAPPVEISTMEPFRAEISPTMPFVANECLKADPMALEISPTMPFVAQAPACIASDVSEKIGEKLPAVEGAPFEERSLKRSRAKLAIEEDLPHHNDFEEPIADSISLDDGGNVEDASRLEKEREWMRHKRRLEMEQRMLGLRAEKAARTLRKEAERAVRLGAEGMSKAERARFEALTLGSKAAIGVAATSTQGTHYRDEVAYEGLAPPGSRRGANKRGLSALIVGA